MMVRNTPPALFRGAARQFAMPSRTSHAQFSHAGAIAPGECLLSSTNRAGRLGRRSREETAAMEASGRAPAGGARSCFFACFSLASMALLVFAAGDVDPGVTAADQWRFAFTMEQARSNYFFSAAHVDWLRESGLVGSQWYDEACRCKRAWDLLDDCRRVHPNDAEKCREKLTKLRELLGPDQWRAGMMPPPAPYWHFRVIE